eukprot:CAMPEP_0172193882 /NCGR_PEP_ID=MMETSP1050-20130122/25236_1 /TAXON_ID=233186 /ORGANISM="Cryptomonas curvata, Strain CCAP979/52" /LENGTH=44 /DNA_ID= /DNA_START= /DNA_END= /DNA_ORIENTATION=
MGSRRFAQDEFNDEEPSASFNDFMTEAPDTISYECDEVYGTHEG